MREDASTHSPFDPRAVATSLAAVVDARRRSGNAATAPWVVGLSGLQGSGKSTFARQLATAANAEGIRTAILALDDFYLGRRDRLRLARQQHPLLITRGVPGTHDIARLTRTLAAMSHASARHPLRVPRFDKGRDTRLPPSRWRALRVAPELIVVEGWCVGLPPQRTSALARPLNALERDEDRDRRWRVWVNAQLADGYARLWQRMDQLLLLQAPDFAMVARWRGEQEQRLRHAARAMDTAALARFLLHYERLSRHALREMPHRADLCLRLGRNHEVLEIRTRWNRRPAGETGMPAPAHASGSAPCMTARSCGRSSGLVR